MRSFTKILVMLLFLGGGFLAYSNLASLPFASVIKENFKTELPVTRDIVYKKLFSGHLVPAKEIKLEAHITGIIDKLYVKPGDYVEKGVSIARISIRPNPNEIQKAESNLHLALIALEQTKKKYLRDKELFNKKMLSRAAYESSLTFWRETQEKVVSARKHLQIVQRGYTQAQGIGANLVKATSRGTILDLLIKEGSMVKATSNQANGTVVAIIGDMSDFLFRAQISELDVVHLYKGASFEIALNASKEEKFQVTLTKIAPKANEEAGNRGEVKFDIEGIIHNQKKSKIMLRAGYIAVAEMVLKRANKVLSIPERLIKMEGDTCFVWCLDEGKKVKKEVVLGLSDGFYAEVKKGIEPTDQLIIEE